MLQGKKNSLDGERIFCLVIFFCSILQSVNWRDIQYISEVNQVKWSTLQIRRYMLGQGLLLYIQRLTLTCFLELIRCLVTWTRATGGSCTNLGQAEKNLGRLAKGKIILEALSVTWKERNKTPTNNLLLLLRGGAPFSA